MLPSNGGVQARLIQQNPFSVDVAAEDMVPWLAMPVWVKIVQRSKYVLERRISDDKRKQGVQYLRECQLLLDGRNTGACGDGFWIH